MFLKQIDEENPSSIDLHLVADNCATHRHPKVVAWLKRFHIRFSHFTSVRLRPDAPVSRE